MWQLQSLRPAQLLKTGSERIRPAPWVCVSWGMCAHMLEGLLTQGWDSKVIWQ